MPDLNSGYVHNIRLRSHGQTYSAACSCGWSSRDDLARAAAAHEAVAHSTICAGEAKMGATLPVIVEVSPPQ